MIKIIEPIVAIILISIGIGIPIYKKLKQEGIIKEKKKK